MRQYTSHPDTLHAKILLGQALVEAAKLHSGDSRRGEDIAHELEQSLREYLADARGRYTNDPLKLAKGLYDAAEPYYRQGNYAEAEPLYREIIELRRSRLSADHKDVLEPTASLARALSDWASAARDSKSEMADRAREAERLLHKVLATRLRNDTNSWRIADVQSRLGGALVSVAITDSTLDAEARRTKLAEAESLLLESHEQLQKESRERKYNRDALQRLVRLYEAWNKPDKRAEWQQKLELFEKAQKNSSAWDSAAAVETK
jgi:hypothetical protein